MLDAVITRLKAQVPDLGGRIEGAVSMAEMMRANRLPENATAIVLPLGLVGQAADTGTGLFRQGISETVGVLLIARSQDRLGEKALARIRPLIGEVIAAIAGWAPGDELGVFQLSRGALVSMAKGTLVYQLDFSINDQLRIPT